MQLSTSVTYWLLLQMENSPVATALENEEGRFERFSSGSSKGTLVVEVVMPRSSSPATAKRARMSISKAADRAKRVKCVMGSPASRLINQMVMSPQSRMTGSPTVAVPSKTSPRPATTRNARGGGNNKKVKGAQVCSFEGVRAYISKWQDKNYKTAPIEEECERSRVVCNFLKTFYEATKVVFGSSYPTANRAFHELWKIKLDMDKESGTEDQLIVAMVRELKKKFNHYWNIAFLYLAIPVILDPRFEYSFVDFRLKQAFVADAEKHLHTVRKTLRKLFNEYSCQMNHSNIEVSTTNDEVSTTNDDSFADRDQHQRAMLRNQSSNEIDNYLEENLIPQTDDFDILAWWKSNCTKWPILSCMAHDVLTILALTVASESAFSIGERVVSDFRSRLSTETLEALICLQDWLRAAAPFTDNIALQVAT